MPDMLNEADQIESLRHIQKRLWRDYQLTSTIIIPFGDVVALVLGGPRSHVPQIVHAMSTGYDAWEFGVPCDNASAMDESEAMRWLVDTQLPD